MPPSYDDLDAVRGRDREQSVARDTAADVADALRGVAQPLVDDALSSVSFMLLAALLVPVGVVIVALGFFAMALIHGALGAPTGILASTITIAGLLGILAALFFSFRALYRRMPRRLRTAYAAPMQPPDAPEGSHSLGLGAHPMDDAFPGRAPSAPAPTLAELDARLAPRAEPPD